MRVWVRIILFLSSYFPLAVIFFIVYRCTNPQFAWAALVLGALGLIGLFSYLTLVSRVSPLPLNVASVNRRDSEAMSYIVTYVIPFLAFPSEAQSKALPLLIFFLTIAVIYINSQMIHINPILNVVGQ